MSPSGLFIIILVGKPMPRLLLYVLFGLGYLLVTGIIGSMVGRFIKRGGM